MKLKKQLIDWADRFEVPGFIDTDPIQFPHRFDRKQDIEISAFLTAYLAFGKRSVIINKVNELHDVMGRSPYSYVMGGDFGDFPSGNKKFYRFISYPDMNGLLTALRSYYVKYDDLETAVNAESPGEPMEAIRRMFGHIHHIPDADSKSACKRIAMLLRWLCRRNSCVDLGIWRTIDPACLLIPLDTHVHRMSLELGITNRRIADMRTAREINAFFEKVFPGDPCRGDYSLFGYAVNG